MGAEAQVSRPTRSGYGPDKITRLEENTHRPEQTMMEFVSLGTYKHQNFIRLSFESLFFIINGLMIIL